LAVPVHSDNIGVLVVIQRSFFRLSVFSLLVAAFACVASDGWVDDFAEAKRLAAEKGVPILVNFSGSDWCGWCIRLDQEVFDQELFKEYAKENLVLFVADFPRRKELPEQVSKQNRELAEKLGIMGFPTVLLIDAEGKEVARTGYQPGGPGLYVAHLKELLTGPKVQPEK
jgi:thioredoxin-related protein